MSKTNMLIAAVIALILLNIFLLIAPRLHQPPPRKGGPQGNIKHVIVDKLKFNDDQRHAYKGLIKQHQANIKEQQDQLRDAQNKLYGNLTVDDQTVKDDLLRQVGDLQMNIQQIHYDHFISIKKLCNTEQLSQFNELQTELGRLFAIRPPKKR